MGNVRRRTVLAALAVSGGAAACTPKSSSKSQKQSEPAEPDPQAADLTAERQLLATYDATISAHAALADRLKPLRDHHAEHVTALEHAVTHPPSAAEVAATVPGTPEQALAALRAAEKSAAAARMKSCVAARADRAPLLGSIAACEASHGVLLT